MDDDVDGDNKVQLNDDDVEEDTDDKDDNGVEMIDAMFLIVCSGSWRGFIILTVASRVKLTLLSCHSKSCLKTEV